MVAKPFHEDLLLSVQRLFFFFTEVDLFVRQPSGLMNCVIISGEGGERRELRGSVQHRHLWASF